MIVVQISDARPQYVQSAVNLCALPVGATTPLRYDLRWVEPSLVARVQRREQLENLILCYLSGNVGGLAHARSIPVRQAVVDRAEIVGKFLVVEARVGPFFDLSVLEATATSAVSAHLLADPRRGYFVYPSPARIDDIALVNNDVVRGWQHVVEKLGATSSLATAGFCLLEGVRLVDGEMTKFDRAGLLDLMPGRNYEVVLHAMVLNYVPSVTVSVVVGINEELGDLIDVPDFKLGRRYDRRTVGIRSRSAGGRVEGIISLSSSSPLTPELALKGAIRARPGMEIVRRVSLGFGAAVAASAAVVPDDWPIWIKFALVVTGSVVVALRSGGGNG